MEQLDGYDVDEIFTAPSLWESNPAARCDACWMRSGYLVEIPRPAGRKGSEPGRFRLCLAHAENVHAADAGAVIYELSSRKRVA